MKSMSFYESWILPPLLDLLMRRREFRKCCRAVVAAARARVLEIRIGSGLNLPLHGEQVEVVFGVDPSE